MGVAFMKICPVCSIRYSEETKYCAKCNAYLEECDEEEYVNVDKKKKKKDPPIPKQFILTIVGTFAFIGFIMLLYYIISQMQ